jgi:RhtB (resistance to homoserine/threonine) family protein
VFISVSAIVILAPGPDMALVTKNAAIHGRSAALGTALGVDAGLLVWTVATALGVASLVRASATAFTVLRVAGAIYLVWLGAQALVAASRRRQPEHSPGAVRRAPVSARRGFRQGLLSNLANPKIAIFFTSLLPQFTGSTRGVLGPYLLLGAVFVAMTLAWLSFYAVIAARASAVLQRPRVKAAIDALTGVVLIGFGLRLATERR